VREQVVSQKVGNRSGLGSRSKGAVTQKPVRRDRDTQVTIAARLRGFVGYVPSALKIGLLVVIAVLALLGYRAAASASFFQVKTIEVAGVSRLSSESVVAAVRREVSETGVWRADLSALNAHLEKLPWVKTAVVTRVLPNGIRRPERSQPPPRRAAWRPAFRSSAPPFRGLNPARCSEYPPADKSSARSNFHMQ